MHLEKTVVKVVLEERKVTKEEYDDLQKLFPDGKIFATEHWTQSTLKPKPKRK